MRVALKEILKHLDAFQETVENHKTDVAPNVLNTTKGQITVIRTYIENLLSSEDLNRNAVKKSLSNLSKNISLFADKAVGTEKEVVSRMNDDVVELTEELSVNNPARS